MRFLLPTLDLNAAMEVDSNTSDGKKDELDSVDDKDLVDPEHCESQEFPDDLKKATEAARKLMAQSTILEWKEEAVAKGETDTSFCDNVLADLEKFVVEHKAELDEILEGGEEKTLKDTGDIEKKKEKKTHKRIVPDGNGNASGDDELEDSETAEPAGKISRVGQAQNNN